jgi:hypothetical protein
MVWHSFDITTTKLLAAFKYLNSGFAGSQIHENAL